MAYIQCGIDTDLSKLIVVGEGTSFVLSGWCFHNQLNIKLIEVIIDNLGFIANSKGNARFDVLDYQQEQGNDLNNVLNSGFWAIINVNKITEPCEKVISLRVVLENNEEQMVNLGTLNLVPSIVQEKLSYNHSSGQILTICMATYNPKIPLFKKQIESIKNQTFKDWICIINDDCSKVSTYQEILDLTKDDSKFFVYRNEKNLGFYKNFEKVLTLVPENTKFVALSDQDDVWHDDKLEKCLATFDKDTTLVYSDMNIVDEEGTILANTYWGNRRNHYKDLKGLLLANTITGAASVFKKDLLNKILPFPNKVGDSFHDWWIGLCAIMAGEIQYVDEPIYDYVQHGANVIGQSNGDSLSGTIKKTLGKFDENKKEELKRILFHGKAIYEYDLKRILLNTNLLAIRFSEYRGTKKFNQLLSFQKGLRIPSLLSLYMKNRIKKIDTLHAEMRLILGLASDKIVRKVYKKREINHIQARKNEVKIPVQKNELTIDHVFHKISPLNIETTDKEKIRLNMIIPTVDFKYFFGGYIGKFNLAKKLAESGYNVRIIIIDYTDFNLNQWKIDIKKYSGLESFFEIVEVEYFFDRSKKLFVNPNDRFLATTWWTAYVAKEAVKKLNFKKFVYLIQEYEPLTFDHGAYYALANETYNFNHFGIFSTELLREYFKINKIGVFKDGLEEGEKNSISFQNAILSFELNKDELKTRKKKKLIYYARPESHASRNMFELGILALNKALELGAFDNEEWELYGMGSVSNYNGIKINENVTMKILPKMSLDDYKEALKEFDIGMSLMFTPHPSLVPQEMASAGMLVVTNSYENKTEEKLKEISSNFIVAKPTIDDVALKIKEAVTKVNDIDRRYEGAKVNWSSDWNLTFNDRFVNKVKGWIN